MGVGTIDHRDRFEDVFDQGCIQKVPENKFTDQISMVRPQKSCKMAIFCRFVTILTLVRFSTFLCIKHIFSFRGCAIHFFISAKCLVVTDSEEQPIFVAAYGKKLWRLGDMKNE